MVAMLWASLQHYGERVGALLEGRQRVGRGAKVCLKVAAREASGSKGRPAGTTWDSA